MTFNEEVNILQFWPLQIGTQQLLGQEESKDPSSLKASQLIFVELSSKIGEKKTHRMRDFL